MPKADEGVSPTSPSPALRLASCLPLPAVAGRGKVDGKERVTKSVSLEALAKDLKMRQIQILANQDSGILRSFATLCRPDIKIKYADTHVDIHFIPHEIKPMVTEALKETAATLAVRRVRLRSASP